VTQKYKTKYRVKNWAAYDVALRERGDIRVWFQITESCTNAIAYTMPVYTFRSRRQCVRRYHGTPWPKPVERAYTGKLTFIDGAGI